MDKRIKLKTDASNEKGVGVGIGYVANVDGNTIKNGQFIENDVTSTEAEMLSTAWSIKNLSEYIDIDPRDYTLVVKTDCENTVNKYESNYVSRYMRFIRYYSRKYKEMLMFWISRSSNQEADKIAKVHLRRGKEQ